MQFVLFHSVLLETEILSWIGTQDLIIARGTCHRFARVGAKILARRTWVLPNSILESLKSNIPFENYMLNLGQAQGIQEPLFWSRLKRFREPSQMIYQSSKPDNPEIEHLWPLIDLARAPSLENLTLHSYWYSHSSSDGVMLSEWINRVPDSVRFLDLRSFHVNIDGFIRVSHFPKDLEGLSLLCTQDSKVWLDPQDLPESVLTLQMILRPPLERIVRFPSGITELNLIARRSRFAPPILIESLPSCLEKLYLSGPGLDLGPQLVLPETLRVLSVFGASKISQNVPWDKMPSSLEVLRCIQWAPADTLPESLWFLSTSFPSPIKKFPKTLQGLVIVSAVNPKTVCSLPDSRLVFCYGHVPDELGPSLEELVATSDYEFLQSAPTRNYPKLKRMVLNFSRYNFLRFLDRFQALEHVILFLSPSFRFDTNTSPEIIQFLRGMVELLEALPQTLQVDILMGQYPPEEFQFLNPSVRVHSLSDTQTEDFPFEFLLPRDSLWFQVYKKQLQPRYSISNKLWDRS